MRLEGRKPRTLTQFLDGPTKEVVLGIEIDEAGRALFSFRLYDSQGELVIDSMEPQAFPQGLNIASTTGEVLLDLPASPQGNIVYRLYNRSGELLTHSDGSRTQVFPKLRMEGKVVSAAAARKAAKV